MVRRASISSETFHRPELGRERRTGPTAHDDRRHQRPELAGHRRAHEIGHEDVRAKLLELDGALERHDESNEKVDEHHDRHRVRARALHRRRQLFPVDAARRAERRDRGDDHLPKEGENELRLPENVDRRAADLREGALGPPFLAGRYADVALVKVNDLLDMRRRAYEFRAFPFAPQAVPHVDQERHRSAVDRRYPGKIEVDSLGAWRNENFVCIRPNRDRLAEFKPPRYTHDGPRRRDVRLVVDLDGEAGTRRNRGEDRGRHPTGDGERYARGEPGVVLVRLVRMLRFKKGMWLEALLTREDLCEVLQQFIPMKLRLGESGDLLLEGPLVVSLIPEKGLSVTCTGQLHWPLFGVRFPATLHSLTVLILPAVEVRPGGDALVFKLRIEHANVALLPRVLDDRLTSLVNEELAKKHAELAWNFRRALSYVFPLPHALESAEALGLQVQAGTVKITDSAVGFAVSLRAEVQRDDAPDTLRPSLLAVSADA